jgi:hypothetical protein
MLQAALLHQTVLLRLSVLNNLSRRGHRSLSCGYYEL